MAPTPPVSAFVLGGTGTVGKAIIKALIDNPNYDRVTVIGRRSLEMPSVSENPNFSKIEQRLIDFEDPDTYDDAFNGYNVGFCALGISSVGISDEAYYRITHDYVMNTAKLALAGGCKHFHFVSGGGTSKTSMFNWARVKAQVEEEITALGFERLSIYRPGGIVKDKTESHSSSDTAGILAYKILDPFHLLSVDSLFLGRAIVNNTFRAVDSQNEVLDNCSIQKVGKEMK